MRLLIFSDTHLNFSILNSTLKKAKKKEADFLVCLGDISWFEDGLKKSLDLIDRANIPCLIIPGNHEDDKTLFSLTKNYKNLIFLHKGVYISDDFAFVGYGNPGFLIEEPDMQSFFNSIKKDIKNKKIILITHGPPHETKLDKLQGSYVGCNTINKFVKENDVLYVFSGHLHENFYLTDKSEKTILKTTGPRGIIIELKN